MMSKLGDVCRFLNGGTPSKAIPEYFEGDLPWITSADIVGPVADTARSHISESAIKNSAVNKVSKGTVLLVTRTGVGKVAIAGSDMCFSQDITALIPEPKKLDAGYLVHFLRTKKSHFERHARGATIKGITRDVVADLFIPLVAIPEQRRIAAILDQADALRAKRREALAQLDSLTQSIFIEMFGDGRSNAKFPLGGIRAFVEANSGKSAKYVLSDAKTDIPIYGGNGINGWATKALYEQPVVVFGRVGQQCGNVCITGGPSWVTDNAIVVRILESTKLNADYLLHAFGESDFSNRVKHLDLPFINQGMILDNPIPMPPVSLQQTFATRIQSVEALKITHKAALQELDRLFASLQHRAFSGEL